MPRQPPPPHPIAGLSWLARCRATRLAAPAALLPARLLTSGLPLIGLLLIGVQPPANAQVNRCETADGRTAYTDKACATIGAVDSLARTGPASTSATPRRRACNRELQDLIFELTAAIDNRDANRLSALYHWPGASTSGGYAVMARLDAIAQRPLVGITELYPADPPPPAPIATTSVAQAGIGTPTLPSPHPPSQSISPSMGARTAQAPRQPSALRLEQTLANQSTPSQSVFGLRRHLGCWWISL
jgi:hypothetical protein